MPDFHAQRLFVAAMLIVALTVITHMLPGCAAFRETVFNGADSREFWAKQERWVYLKEEKPTERQP